MIRNSLDLKPIEHRAENTGLCETTLKCFTFCVKLFRKSNNNSLELTSLLYSVLDFQLFT